jgi:hypothetical protein
MPKRPATQAAAAVIGVPNQAAASAAFAKSPNAMTSRESHDVFQPRQARCA